jgi:endonuclease/exonuclease/phosphatase family metal-dependent hydrolase
MKKLEIVTFNIRCFGFDGDYFAKNKAETRINKLKDFIEQNFPQTDLYVFQEIMDLSLLHKILPPDFDMVHYEHDYKRHMHIVFAYNNKYTFKNLKTIPHTALDETKSRPVLYGLLVEDEKPLAHIIGVHLKSSYEHTDKRINQCQLVFDFVQNLDSQLPIIMTGDFNSHFKAKTTKQNDDLYYFKNIFKNQLSLIEHGQPTYLTSNDNIQLDHFWTRGAKVLKSEVYNLDNYSKNNTFQKYYSEISDHLPVKTIIEINP